METINKLRHDFTNSSLKIDILTKLIIDQINADHKPDRGILKDIENEMPKFIELLEEIKKI
jgi:hypothetical protein